PNLRDTLAVKVGLTVHTLGSTVTTVAVTLGARVVEKRFILDRSLGGVDATFSMEPKELKEMVIACHDVLAALGEIKYELTDRNKNRRRSLFVSEDIKKGESLTEDYIKSVRPGMGLHPKYYYEVLGKIVKRDIEKGEPLSLTD